MIYKGINVKKDEKRKLKEFDRLINIVSKTAGIPEKYLRPRSGASGTGYSLLDKKSKIIIGIDPAWGENPSIVFFDLENNKIIRAAGEVMGKKAAPSRTGYPSYSTDSTPLYPLISQTGSSYHSTPKFQRKTMGIKNPAPESRGVDYENSEESLGERREKELGPIRIAVYQDMEHNRIRIRMIAMARMNEDLNKGPNVIQMRRKSK